MKKIISTFGIVLILVLSSSIFARTNKVVSSNVEDNMIVGLQSDNLGLKTSSAYLLGEYGSSKSVIPLMKVLKNGETEEERISAAVALIKLNTAQSVFAVKQRAKFDDSERVRRLCNMFYINSLQNN